MRAAIEFSECFRNQGNRDEDLTRCNRNASPGYQARVGADDTPPFRQDDPASSPTLRFPPPVDMRLGELRIQFERTTLREIQRAAGSGRIAHKGDADNSTYWLCYTGTADSTPVHLWLMAGELGGLDQSIGAVQLQEATNHSMPEADCPALPQTLQAISFGRAAVLGLTSAEAISRLGKPSSKTANSLTYSYLGRKRGKEKGKTVEFDQSNILELRLSAGKVVGLVASQSTTN